jgi:DinB family protein
MQIADMIAAFEAQERDSATYWNAFDDAVFAEKIGTGWSPSDTVRHLSKSTRAVAQALGYPKIMLRIMFGRAGRPSMSWDELVTKYRAKLDEGGRAGRFGPSAGEKARAEIMSDFAGVQRQLRARILRCSEKQLDRIQLPHPILGKLTVREMLMFTLYHQRHHIDVITRRLAQQA